ARKQSEAYRELLMNIFLFFPFGLTLSNALPQNWGRWRRIGLTVITGLLLSAGIEYIQYRFALGVAETDDVICNTIGAFIGSTSLLIAHGIEKYNEKTIKHDSNKS
ncbi:MAG: VanZ family protein, partial [Escherichia coli]|nr:VanZ family protein [Escherichia coli]